MKTSYTLKIEVKVTFDNWEDSGKVTKKEIISKTKSFLEGYYPITQTSFGRVLGELSVNLKDIY